MEAGKDLEGKPENNNHAKKNTVKEFFKMGEVGEYFFRGNDPTRPKNINLKMMHGINKFSIVVFVLGIIFFLIKHFL